MGPIKNIAGMPANINKADKNTEMKKVDEGKTQKKNEAVGKSASSKDRLEISSDAKDLLTMRTEANDPRFIKEVMDAETLDAAELASIKERMDEGYYSNPEVIDHIVDKLLDLPNLISKTSRFDDV